MFSMPEANSTRLGRVSPVILHQGPDLESEVLGALTARVLQTVASPQVGMRRPPFLPPGTDLTVTLSTTPTFHPVRTARLQSSISSMYIKNRLSNPPSCLSTDARHSITDPSMLSLSHGWQAPGCRLAGRCPILPCPTRVIPQENISPSDDDREGPTTAYLRSAARAEQSKSISRALMRTSWVTIRSHSGSISSARPSPTFMPSAYPRFDAFSITVAHTPSGIRTTSPGRLGL